MRKVLVLAVVFLVVEVRADEPVVVTGATESAHAWRGYDAVPFWVRIQNNGKDMLTDVDVTLLGDARVISPCWQAANRTSECAASAGVVAPGNTVLLQAALPAPTAGDFRPHAVVSWRGSQGLQMRPVSLGRVVVERYWWTWAQWVSDLLKNIALPVVVVILGALYQRRLQQEQTQRQAEQAQRDAAVRAHERDLAKTQADVDRLRAERAETLRIMLPRSHRYTTRYYAALSLRAQELVQSIQEQRTAPGEQNLKSVVFWFVSLHHVNRLFMRDVGAFYLKDRAAEEIVTGAFRIVDDQVFTGFKPASDAVTAVLDELDSKVVVIPEATFWAKVDNSTKARPAEGIVRHRLRQWVPTASCADTLGCLSLYSAVLDFEMNRIYENWYPTRERLALGSDAPPALARVKAVRPASAAAIDAYVVSSVAIT